MHNRKQIKTRIKNPPKERKTYYLRVSGEIQGTRSLLRNIESQRYDLEELSESLEKIKSNYYSNNTRIKRIQSQSFFHILKSKFPRIILSILHKIEV